MSNIRRSLRSHNTFLIEVKLLANGSPVTAQGRESQHLLNRGQTLSPNSPNNLYLSKLTKSQHLLNRGQTSPLPRGAGSGRWSQHLLNRGQTLLRRVRRVCRLPSHNTFLIEVKQRGPDWRTPERSGHNTFLIEVKPWKRQPREDHKRVTTPS